MMNSGQFSRAGGAPAPGRMQCVELIPRFNRSEQAGARLDEVDLFMVESASVGSTL